MVRVGIPGGIWGNVGERGAHPNRELALRPVSGDDEAFLLDTIEFSSPSERATGLLARCLRGPSNDETARMLTIGDREALLLQLRRLTLGEKLDCVLSCPADDCGDRMEIELSVTDLLVDEYPDVRREYELAVDSAGMRYEIGFRVPIAADLEKVAAIALTDPQRAATSLLEACVRHATRDGMNVEVGALEPAVRSAISASMAEHDPQAEIELDLACPSCGREFSVVFDTAMFFLQELDARGKQLMQDVHTLAWHYHWSEHDILQMSHKRRAHYLELVSSTSGLGLR